VSYTEAQVTQNFDGYSFAYPNLFNAANAVKNASGQIVCAVNKTTVTDPNCQPLNIFGTGPIPQATLDYILKPSGNNVGSVYEDTINRHQDFLATISGDLITLPGGDAKFSLTYEHRRETSKMTPTAGDLAGIFYTGAPTLGARGSYSTNEFAAEADIPLVGGDFTLPLVKALDLTGSYRYVDNSLVGGESVWSGGLRWNVGYGLTLRATRSRNFRAPDLNQVIAPVSSSIGSPGNPCSNTLIQSGPSPSTRAANCLALFTANPTYGLDQLPAGIANTPANRLNHFTGSLVALATVQFTGNPSLQNEIADTTTVGLVYQPEFIPGLVFSADILRLKLANALTLFSPDNFAATCFDAASQPAQYCGTLKYNANGQIVGAISTTVNAGSQITNAEVFNVDYRFNLDRLSEKLPGAVNLILQATHNSDQETTFAGTTTRTDGTIVLPKWVVRFDARYHYGPIGLFYSMNYLPASLITATSTVENSTNGVFRVKDNIRHNVSAEYVFDEKYRVRAGVNNLTNEPVSYPTFSPGLGSFNPYGDIIGRQFFLAVDAKF
jgi:outer membrane receptor protein involved in Fe transport